MGRFVRAGRRGRFGDSSLVGAPLASDTASVVSRAGRSGWR
jgi:hypothetical protein